MDTDKTTPSWLNKATGAIDVEKLMDANDGMFSVAKDLQHSLHHLMSDLEFSFDFNRGKVDGNEVTLRFQKDGIDAALWLAAMAWNRAKDLVDIIEAVQNANDEAE